MSERQLGNLLLPLHAPRVSFHIRGWGTLEDALVVIDIELVGRPILFIATVDESWHLNSANFSIVVQTTTVICRPLAATSRSTTVRHNSHWQMSFSVEVEVRPHISLVVNHC